MRFATIDLVINRSGLVRDNLILLDQCTWVMLDRLVHLDYAGQISVPGLCWTDECTWVMLDR